jgi:type I restriction-modification system DNA methylase subunit
MYNQKANMEIEEKPHHGISINVGDYKNPYEVNRAIEKLLNEKGSEQESYTPDEINFLSYYSGYGGLEKKGTFSQDELKGLLYEFFTPDEVVQKMWGLAYKYGYGSIGDNSVFEPSVGIGAFLKYAPDNVYVAANEINRYSAMICNILYPNVRTILMPFERNFISSNMSVKKNFQNLKKYSLVIGNPPYGKLGGIYLPMGEDKYTGASNWAEYFLFRGIDLLHKGGLLIYIIGAEQYNGGNLFLDSALTTTKKAIFEKADLIDAYRLPTKIFERTGVSSEIVIFRKR